MKQQKNHKFIVRRGEDTTTYGRRYDESQFGGSRQSDNKK